MCIAVCLWSQTPDKEKAAFQGSVRDSVSKAPIPKASVKVLPSGGNLPSYTGESGPDGAFHFEAIAPGDYQIQVRGRGHADSENTPPLHLTAGQTLKDFVIELDPEAVVTGRVMDADGEPVPYAQVMTIAEKWERGFRTYRPIGSTEANDRGEYRLHLLPGRYYLSAHPDSSAPTVFTDGPGDPEWRTLPVIYPNASTVEGATLFDLGPGQQVSGIAFKLRNEVTYHVRGTVRVFAAPAPVIFVSLYRRSGGRAQAVAGARVGKDGSFDARGVPPGSYWLELMPFLRGSPTGGMAVEVTDRDVNGVRMESFPQFEIKGRVRFAEESGGVPFASFRVLINMLGWRIFPFASSAKLTDDGAFSVPNLSAGEYVISLPPDRDLFIQSVWYNQHIVEGGRLDLMNGPAGDVEIVLGTGTGDVDGKVVSDALPPEATAILVSATGPTGNNLARGAAIDSSGHFHFRFVPPGRYFVFASPKFDEGLWQNADFVQEIRGSGAPAELAAKGRATVEIPLLTAADIQRAADKVPR